MTEVQKKAVKDLLHTLVDNEEIALLKDAFAHLPPTYSSILDGILDMGSAGLIAAEDKVIDEKLA